MARLPPSGCASTAVVDWAKVEIRGEEPACDTLLVSCDQNYLDRYLAPLAHSVAKRTQKHLHVHVLNPEHLGQFDLLRRSFSARAGQGSAQRLSLSYSFVDAEALGSAFATYCACARFIVADYFSCENCLILDIDSIFRRDLSWPDADVGLFLRDFNKSGRPKPSNTRVAAGIVYVSRNGRSFVKEVVRRLTKREGEWYADQVALYESYAALFDSLKYHFFDAGTFDWEFQPESCIWTDKGRTQKSLQFYFESNDLSWTFFERPDD